MIQILGLLLLCTGAAAELLLCTQVSGKLKQIDAGAGLVYGVNDAGNIYKWADPTWTLISGMLSHVTVGQGGIWGVNSANNVYKFQSNNWLLVNGALKQIDAGGNKFVVGVNAANSIFCLNQDQTYSLSASLVYTGVDGILKYYSCGLYGCWGVNPNNDIFYRYGVQPTACNGNRWQQVDGTLAMVEVGADGSVYGVSPLGDVYEREGISEMNPIGTNWNKLEACGKFRHVSYDKGILWAIAVNGDIYKCQANCPSC